MQIGRKIYYELATGNLILDTGERQGDVVETTETQDFQIYTALQPYQQSAVGVLQLTFGQDAQNFGQYPFHVDTTTQTIVWDTANPIGASLSDVQIIKVNQLKDLYQQTLAAGFNVTIGTTQYAFGWTTDDKANMNAAQTAIDKAFTTFPISYADIHGNPVSVPDQATLNTIESMATKFAFAQHQQILNLIGQVRSATTVTAVNNISWTAATY